MTFTVIVYPGDIHGITYTWQISNSSGTVILDLETEKAYLTHRFSTADVRMIQAQTSISQVLLCCCRPHPSTDNGGGSKIRTTADGIPLSSRHPGSLVDWYGSQGIHTTIPTLGCCLDKTKQSHTKSRQNTLHSVHSRPCRI